MYLVPGMTAEVFRQAAKDVGVCKEVDLGKRTAELWPSVRETSPGQWKALRARCEALVRG